MEEKNIIRYQQLIEKSEMIGVWKLDPLEQLELSHFDKKLEEYVNFNSISQYIAILRDLFYNEIDVFTFGSKFHQLYAQDDETFESLQTNVNKLSEIEFFEEDHPEFSELIFSIWGVFENLNSNLGLYDQSTLDRGVRSTLAAIYLDYLDTYGDNDLKNY